MQYKIMHVLTSTWKCVWQQFSPYTRSFSPSSIYSAQGLETAETLCNRLWEWRRLVSISDWRRLTSASAQVLPPLPSGRHPEAYTYLATHPLPQIQQRESKEQCLFRIELVQAMVRDNVHSDAQIERLISLLSERHQGDMRSICHTMRREFLG